MAAPRFAALGGGGWLGGALVRAALSAGVIAPATTVVTSRRGAVDGFEAFAGLGMTADNRQAAAQADVVLVAVRPGDIDALDADLSGKLVLSVMAMVPIDELAGRFGCRRIVRAMPNAAAGRLKSFTPMVAGEALDEQDRRFAEAFFAASGIAEWLPDERALDYFTGLTGSGPAFFAALAAAMERDAVARGFDAALAARAIRQLLAGAAEELAGERSPSELVSIFKDYRGTTAAGLTAMEEHGLDPLVRAMLEAAERRAAGLT
ncbi:pyrroline-5-carboxylate reductase family protein [Gellertiella hungarica]|uniref:Pyrroline-5-carboxylate reductase n=1 Tax=Gellertiella hungarica TaxID=1572859 RepID=A0A7W6NLX1_9HYPH|nr:pyrroline-5-carboxylate reductase dimerization domain-containing protein [Gellertiella hungarica]MBB4066368.1 pyrroline-5-carboxylate reductase [Gellertiella hungarica]